MNHTREELVAAWKADQLVDAESSEARAQELPPGSEELAPLLNYAAACRSNSEREPTERELGGYPDDPHYNTENYPVRLTQSDRNHDIWGNPETGGCAAIPTAVGWSRGCKASQFGDRAYFRTMKWDMPGVTEAGRLW